jgi:hypothetical protein
VNHRNIGPQEPNLRIRVPLLRILEYAAMLFKMQGFNLFVTLAVYAHDVHEIGVVGKGRRPSLHVVSIPGVFHARDEVPNCFVIVIAHQRLCPLPTL